jgi:hypothetical protein
LGTTTSKSGEYDISHWIEDKKVAGIPFPEEVLHEKLSQKAFKTFKAMGHYQFKEIPLELGQC